MANDEERTIVEAGDGDTSVAEDEQPKKGSNKKLILFGGIGLGVVILGVALALFVIKPMTSGTKGESDENTEEMAQAEGDHGEAKTKPEHKKPKKKKKKSHGKEQVSEMFAISDIVINPAGTGGSRYLSVSFSFDLESAETYALFEAREPVIRDALITILSSRTVAQLTDAKQKEIVRYQIKKRVSKLLKTDELAAVYYTDFVLQ